MKACNHLQGHMSVQRELDKITEKLTDCVFLSIQSKYDFESWPIAAASIGFLHHTCQINFPNYFFVIDLIIWVKFLSKEQLEEKVVEKEQLEELVVESPRITSFLKLHPTSECQGHIFVNLNKVSR